MHVLNIANFTRSANNKIGTGAKFSHKICRGTLIGNPKTWICKEMKRPRSARIELLSQEFFRLIISYQPETLIAENPTTGVYYILSEEVPGYRNLPEDEAINFTNGSYLGLGQIMVGAMYLQEIDLKNGNVGLDNQNRVIKIDGDWCFAESDYPRGYKLTPEAIEYLPFPKDYYTYNWLDIVYAGTYKVKSKIIDPALSNAEQYRTEVNTALLKICLIPDRYLEQFVDQYIPAGAYKYSQLMKLRRNELMESALKNASFKAYLQTSAAVLEAEAFFKQLKNFKAANIAIVPKEKRAEFKRGFEEQCAKLEPLNYKLKHLSSLYTSHPYQATLRKCNYLLNKLKANIHIKDILLKDKVKELEREVRINSKNHNELKKIKTKIQSIIEIMNSPEVVAVQKRIKFFRDSAGFFTMGRNSKANAIEAALHSIPLRLRAKVISDSKVNAVQEALATHRHLGKRGIVYKTKGNKIDIACAAHSFVELRALFKETKEVNHHDGTTSNGHLPIQTKQI